MVEIYNEVVHDLLSDDAKRQVELQKTATGFDIPSITTIGAHGASRSWAPQHPVAALGSLHTSMASHRRTAPF